MRNSRQHLAAATALAAIGAAAAMVLVQPARATEVYVKGGAPGFILGLAQPLGEYGGLRLDFASVGTLHGVRREGGLSYESSLRLDRAALLADWFVFGGRFRLTGGVTRARHELDLAVSGAGGSLTVGTARYVTTAADQFRVQIRMPKSMPYVGLGWGHQRSDGLRFSFDLGAQLGQAELGYHVSGPWTSGLSQADIDAEMAELRQDVGRIKAIPQLSVGLGWSF